MYTNGYTRVPALERCDAQHDAHKLLYYVITNTPDYAPNSNSVCNVNTTPVTPYGECTQYRSTCITLNKFMGVTRPCTRDSYGKVYVVHTPFQRNLHV